MKICVSEFDIKTDLKERDCKDVNRMRSNSGKCIWTRTFKIISLIEIWFLKIIDVSGQIEWLFSFQEGSFVVWLMKKY